MYVGRLLYILVPLSIYLMPCMHLVLQCSWCLLEQETQTNLLWVPKQGLVFVRSNDVIYGGQGFNIICAHLTFGDQLRERKARQSRPLF
jgi:hypothetical protein